MPRPPATSRNSAATTHSTACWWPRLPAPGCGCLLLIRSCSGWAVTSSSTHDLRRAGYGGGAGRLRGLGALALGLTVRFIPGPAAAGALVAQQPGLLVDRLGGRAAARAGQVSGVGQGGPRAGPDLFGLGDPGHHVVQLGVAAQH